MEVSYYKKVLVLMGVIFITTDKNSFIIDFPHSKIIDLVELRLPYPVFNFQIIAETTPASGDIAIQSIRRY